MKVSKQRYVSRRVSKDMWRDFGRLVRTARRYSAAGLEAVAVVEELNEFVTFHDLEQFVQLSVSNDKAQTCLPFIETETSKEAAQ